MKKNEYLKTIKTAGFEKVKVISESTYPLDFFIDDPAAKVIMTDLKITPEQVKDISTSIASVKVQGLKPSPGTN
jgi:hypothetical protein